MDGFCNGERAKPGLEPINLSSQLRSVCRMVERTSSGRGSLERIHIYYEATWLWACHQSTWSGSFVASNAKLALLSPRSWSRLTPGIAKLYLDFLVVYFAGFFKVQYAIEPKSKEQNQFFKIVRVIKRQIQVFLINLKTMSAAKDNFCSHRFHPAPSISTFLAADNIVVLNSYFHLPSSFMSCRSKSASLSHRAHLGGGPPWQRRSVGFIPASSRCKSNLITSDYFLMPIIPMAFQT